MLTDRGRKELELFEREDGTLSRESAKTMRPLDCELSRSVLQMSDARLSVGGMVGMVSEGKLRRGPREIRVCIKHVQCPIVLEQYPAERDRGATYALDYLTDATFKHENLVRFFGGVTPNPDDPRSTWLLVTDLLDPTPLPKFIRDRGAATDVPALLDVCRQVAVGMAVIEATGRVSHGRLSLRNILVRRTSPNLVVAVSDYGLTHALGIETRVEQYGSRRGQDARAFVIRRQAPEAIIASRPLELLDQTMADVWSFGVLCWELLHRCIKEPYDTMSASEILEFLHRDGENRLRRPRDCPEWCWREILVKCWDEDPCERQSFRGIQRVFEQHLR